MLLDELAAQKKGNLRNSVFFPLRFREQRLLADKRRHFCAWQVTCSYQVKINLLLTEGEGHTYILLTKREGLKGGISARGLDNTDRAQQGPCKKDRGPIFSQYGPDQA